MLNITMLEKEKKKQIKNYGSVKLVLNAVVSFSTLVLCIIYLVSLGDLFLFLFFLNKF